MPALSDIVVRGAKKDGKRSDHSRWQHVSGRCGRIPNNARRRKAAGSDVEPDWFYALLPIGPREL